MDPDPGGPKTCGPGSGFGPGSATQVQIMTDPEAHKLTDPDPQERLGRVVPAPPLGHPLPPHFSICLPHYYCHEAQPTPTPPVLLSCFCEF